MGVAQELMSLLIAVTTPLADLIPRQYVDSIAKAVKGVVGHLLNSKDERKNQAEVCEQLELSKLLERNVEVSDVAAAVCVCVCVCVLVAQKGEATTPVFSVYLLTLCPVGTFRW
jgi:translation initiation factor RLI1